MNKYIVLKLIEESKKFIFLRNPIKEVFFLKNFYTDSQVAKMQNSSKLVKQDTDDLQALRGVKKKGQRGRSNG